MSVVGALVMLPFLALMECDPCFLKRLHNPHSRSRTTVATIEAVDIRAHRKVE